MALAATIVDNEDIWVWDFARKTLRRLTFDEGSDGSPLRAPDGKRIAFSSIRNGNSIIHWRAADGTGKDEPVVGSAFPETATRNFPLSWSGDGKILVVMQNFFPNGKANLNFGVLAMEGDSKYRPLLKEKYHESQPQISPNGRWMAYVSNESGQAQIYVRPFPEVDAGRWQVSTSGGNSPLWSRDGRELFYRSGDAVILVPVKTEPAFSFETPKTLFRGAYRPGMPLSPYQWDVSLDSKRFLMMKEAGATASTGGGAPKINIVLNWFEELKQRVPAK